MTETVSIANIKCARGGFITEADLPHIIKENRLQPLLVRCGGCRFTTPAQDVDHLIDIIDAAGTDYVRDVSLPA